MARRNQPDTISRRGGEELGAPARGRGAPRMLRGLIVFLGCSAVVIAGAAGAVWPRSGWRVEPTPYPASADISFLSSVACSSGRACTAVGGASHSLSSTEKPLAERWNGTRWRIQPIPTPARTSDHLAGVSCPSARACIAVGSAFHLAGRRQTGLTEVWDGRRWRVQQTPTIKAPWALFAVSCTAASSCVAVGHTLVSPGKAIAEMWNGRIWRLQATPQLGGDTSLSGVSCARARFCTAVGSNNATGNTRPLAESWNGQTWRVQAVPLPQVTSPPGGPRVPQSGLFEAVSCRSLTACTATGAEFNNPAFGPTLAERWNGRVWRVERTPKPADWTASAAQPMLNGVACSSANACTATGEYNPGHRTQYFVDSWNGTRWRLQSVPHPADFVHGALLGIACTSAHCVAVGAYTGRVRTQVTLAIGN